MLAWLRFGLLSVDRSLLRSLGPRVLLILASLVHLDIWVELILKPSLSFYDEPHHSYCHL